MTPLEFRDELTFVKKTRVCALSVSEEITTLALFVSIQYQSVRERRTDGHLCYSNTIACIARAAALLIIDDSRAAAGRKCKVWNYKRDSMSARARA